MYTTYHENGEFRAITTGGTSEESNKLDNTNISRATNGLDAESSIIKNDGVLNDEK